MSPSLTFKPVTKRYWPAFAQLFGERGACGGCWCMLWRSSRKEFEANKGAGNKRAMKSLVEAGKKPGILAFDGKTPVGWCAVAPRESYPSLARSRVLKPVDEQPVWSIACLFIEKFYRKQGVAAALLEAAAGHARSQGAAIIEGYPVEPKTGQDIPAAFAWTGVPKSFARAGFHEVARRSPTRPIMRLVLD